MNLYNLTPYEDGMEDGKICRGCKDPKCTCKDPYILTENGMIFVYKGNYIGVDEKGNKVIVEFKKEERWDDKPCVMIIKSKKG